MASASTKRGISASATTSRLSANASDGWAEAIAKEIGGDVIPPHGKSAQQLAAIWGRSVKGAYLEAERRVSIGELVRGVSRTKTGHRCMYYWPKK